MPETQTDLNEILSHTFVQDLLKFVSEIRSALGDEEGTLDNDAVVKRAAEAYKAQSN